MNYNLKLKYKNERGWWNMTIIADNIDEAIKDVEEKLKNEENLEKAKLQELKFKYKTLKEWNKE